MACRGTLELALRRMGRGPLAAVVAAALLAGTSQGAVVDQANIGPVSGGSLLAGAYVAVGQSVTAELTGHLVRVELDARRISFFEGPWTLSIQQVSGGLPTAVTLASAPVVAADFLTTGDPPIFEPPLSLIVDLPTPVFFSAGEQFAIVLAPDGVTNPPIGLGTGVWSTGGSYDGGGPVSGNSAATLQIRAGGDLLFRTFVEVVPEPGSATLALSLLGAAVHCARRGHGTRGGAT